MVLPWTFFYPAHSPVWLDENPSAVTSDCAMTTSLLQYCPPSLLSSSFVSPTHPSLVPFSLVHLLNVRCRCGNQSLCIISTSSRVRCFSTRTQRLHLLSFQIFTLSCFSLQKAVVGPRASPKNHALPRAMGSEQKNSATQSEDK